MIASVTAASRAAVMSFFTGHFLLKKDTKQKPSRSRGKTAFQSASGSSGSRQAEHIVAAASTHAQPSSHAMSSVQLQ